MKYAIAGEHKDFYHKNRLIEFDNLLTPHQLNQLNKGLDTVLALRLGVPIYKLKDAKAEALFMAGRDSWRMNDEIRRMITNQRLAEIATEICLQKPLRIGYDQFFPETKTLFDPNPQEYLYFQYINHKNKTLHEMSCIQDISCCLMLCLEGKEADKPAEISVFSSTPGSGIYFDPNLPIDFSQMENFSKHRYLLITYTHPAATYILNEIDPHAHALKHLGYGFGDRLIDKVNPIIIR